MFYPPLPGVLSQEYEARVAAALRRRTSMIEAQASRPRRPDRASLGKPWAGLSAWWGRRWARLIRSLQPAEDAGYIA